MGISVSVNFLSMFIVTPMLTKQPVVYGIYMVCISTTIFLSYADLGFLGAAAKFSSEFFARKEFNKEVKLLGFVSFILLCGAIIYTALLLVVAYNPSIIIKNISDPSQLTLARKLLIIMAISAPLIIFQRCIQVLFSVRLEDYIIQRFNIGISLLKIASVYYFFRGSNNNIVGYFLFSQSMLLISTAIVVHLAKKRYSFHLGEYLKSIKFSKELFELTKNFAFTSLLAVITWVIYYEMDPFAISRLLGPQQLAIYAIGLSLMTVFRTLFGVLYNPFNARFNHFIGTKDYNGLSSFYSKVIFNFFPITIFPVLTITILMKKFILCWVGSLYSESIMISVILLSSYLFSFISYPSGILLSAQQRLSTINWLSILLVFIYWGGIAIFISTYQLKIFAVMKFSTFAISAIVYLWITAKFLKGEFKKELKAGILPLIAGSVVLLSVLLPCLHFLPEVKNKLFLGMVVSTGAAACSLSIIVYILLHNNLRLDMRNGLKRLMSK